MKKLLITVIFSVLLNSNELKIAAAANISYPINELREKFEKLYPDIKLVINLGASGGFFAQIINGADYDVFLSANMKFAEDLQKYTKTIAKPYAQGRLILFTPKQKASLDALKTADCIAIANPKTAPYGKAASEVLNHVENSKKIIQATSISATLSQVLKACDIGLLAASSKQEILKLGYKDENMILISNELHEPILQGMIITSNNEKARLFYDFILSDEAKEVFKKYGYE